MGVSFKERYKISDTYMYMMAHDVEARFQAVPHFHSPSYSPHQSRHYLTTLRLRQAAHCMAYLKAHNITSSQRETSGPACIHSIAVV